MKRNSNTVLLKISVVVLLADMFVLVARHMHCAFAICIYRSSFTTCILPSIYNFVQHLLLKLTLTQHLECL